MDKILVIAGPTAVGKTALSIRTALAAGGEIVSADSMQLYKFLNIGSAKPSAAELAACRHHLVDEIDPRTPFSAAEYQRRAKAAIRDIFSRGKLPVIAGGTGLYISSLIYNMDFSAPPAGRDYREQYERMAATEGLQAVHDVLARLDPQAAGRIHPNNLKKVIRAIEVAQTSGTALRPFSEAFVPTPDYEVVLCGLMRERQELYRRIDRRVDQLMAAGLAAEVRRLMEMGLTEEDISMKGIGYKELIGAFNGAYDLERAVELVKQNTRHYAKRQMTWFRRYPEIAWFDLTELGEQEVCECLIKRISK